MEEKYYFNTGEDLLDELVARGYDPREAYENTALGLKFEFTQGTEVFQISDLITDSVLRNLKVSETYSNDKGEIWVKTSYGSKFKIAE